MALFPFPMGGTSFEEADRYERATRLVRSMAGEGGYTDVEEAVVGRTFSIYGMLVAGISLATTRMIENIFANRALPEDLLPRHEEELNAIPIQGEPVEDRWARLQRIWSDEGGGDVFSIAAHLAIFAGFSVNPVLNTAAALDLAGQSRKFMFAVAFEVPVEFITTIGQVNFLNNLIALYKPSTVNAVVTRPLDFIDPMGMMHSGFLTDDPYSLTDRDVLAPGQ